ncbi:MAG: tyrosine-type recombinase/integrase [Clostridiales bacterium]|jgi:site-specific recombinase XerD|nr:tyrosine-type recombinase/integrase [Clostridiales bacterium]
MNKSYYTERNQKYLLDLEKCKLQLPKFCEQFFVGIQVTSILTRVGYAHDLKIFFDFLVRKIITNKAVRDLTLQDLDKISAFNLESFLSYLSCFEFNGKMQQNGDCAKDRKLSTVKVLLKYFYNKDKLTSDVSSKVASIKIKDKNIIKLEHDEIIKLLDIDKVLETFSNHQRIFLQQTKKRDLAILVFFLGTGIRISELVGLDIKNIDFNNNSFSIIRKGGDSDILYFSNEVADKLQDYLAQREGSKELALFLSLQGKRLQVRAVENMVKKYTQKIAPLKNITPHKLRTSFATQLYRKTNDIYVVAEVLGHKDINTTRRHYAECGVDNKMKAAEVIKYWI